MDADHQNDSRKAVLAFLGKLPGSITRLRTADARWIMEQLMEPGAEQGLNLLQTSEWAERMGSAPGLCIPTVFCTRMANTLGIIFDILDVNTLMDLQDPDLVKWIKVAQAALPGHEKESPELQFRCTNTGCEPASSVPHYRWQTERIALGRRWAQLLEQAQNLQDPNIRRRLMQGMSLFET